MLAVDALTVVAEYTVVRLKEVIQHAETSECMDSWAALRRVKNNVMQRSDPRKGTQCHIIVDLVTFMEKGILLCMSVSTSLRAHDCLPWLLLFGRVFFNRSWVEYARSSRRVVSKADRGDGNEYALTGVPLGARVIEPTTGLLHLVRPPHRETLQPILTHVRALTWDRPAFLELTERFGLHDGAFPLWEEQFRVLAEGLPPHLPRAVQATAISCRLWALSSGRPPRNACANACCGRLFPAARVGSQALRKEGLADIAVSFFQAGLSGERSVRTRFYWLFTMGFAAHIEELESDLCLLRREPERSPARAALFCSRTCADEYVRELSRRLPVPPLDGWDAAEARVTPRRSRSLVAKALETSLARSAQCERAMRAPHVPTAASAEDHALFARLVCEAVNVDLGVLGASNRVAESAVLSTKKGFLPGTEVSWRLDRLAYAKPVQEVRKILSHKPFPRFFNNRLCPPPFYQTVQTRAAMIV